MLKDWDPRLIKKLSVVISAIPSGRVASYSQIASLSGMPRGHRNVVRFLKYCKPDLNIDVPWYRVLRADGQIGLEPQTTAYKYQTEQLRSEGVLLAGSKIDMKKYQWQPDLDFFLFHPDL